MTENMKIAIEAVNKWFYFSMNYETVLHSWRGMRGEQRTEHIPKFLVEADWNCHLDHMVAKWSECTERGDCYDYLNRFYAELDRHNQLALLKWVVSKYNGEKKII